MSLSGRIQLAHLGALGALVSIVVAGFLAVSVTPEDTFVAHWWPAAGIGLVLIALAPRPWWPWLALGVTACSTAGNHLGGVPLGLAAMFGVVNAAAAVMAGLYLRADQPDGPHLRTLEDFLRLVRAALIGAGTSGVGFAVLAAFTGADPVVFAFLSVAAANAAADLVVVSLVLAWRRPTVPYRRQELAVQTLAFGAVLAVVFCPRQSVSLAFLALPFLVWAGLRLGTRITTLQLMALSVVVTLTTARELGPFARGLGSVTLDTQTAGALVQAYLVCAALMALPLAVTVEQRRELLAEICAREQLFRRNFADSLVGMALLRQGSAGLEITDINDVATCMLGGGRDTLVGRPLDAVVETDVSMPQVLEQLTSAGEWRDDVRLPNRPGSRLKIAVSPLAGVPGEPVFSAQIIDFTPEHEAREHLRAERELTRATLEATACIILLVDLQGIVQRANRATTTITGFTREQLEGRPVWETVVPPAERDHVRALFAPLDVDTFPSSQETSTHRADGGRLRVVWSNDAVRDETGAATYLVMTGLDVTEERTTAGLMTHLIQADNTTALIGLDNAGLITVFNTGARHLLGRRGQQMVGRPFTDVLAPSTTVTWPRDADGGPDFASLVDTLRRTGTPQLSDSTWITGAAREITVSMTLSIVKDAFGSAIGFLCVARDVTEQRRGQMMLVAALDKERHAVDRLRQLDRAKNDFVSTVSHELRTPVTSIVGYTEMLQDGSVVDALPEQAPFLDAIERNGTRLIALANDLLTLSGLESGTATWQREQVDLAHLVCEARETMRPLLEGRKLDLAFDVVAHEVLVDGDPAHLERVLLNLLNNAVKFTEDEGSITCTVSVDETRALLVVSDTGIGIPVEEQAGLFQKFFRSSTAQSRAIQGTGLGLSIIASIVDAHGGAIDVESAHLAGTTFTVSLPLSAGARTGG
ncbi:ATP-binding protein [Nocardioides pacificus]